MTSTAPGPVVAPSDFRSLFSSALLAYKKQTNEDLLMHPLAARLQSRDSPDAILSILREQAQAFDRSRNSEEKLTESLGSTVYVLHTLSSSLREGVGLVLSPANVIFVGIGVLLSATEAISSSQNKLIDIFKRLDHLFKQIEPYLDVLPNISSTKINEEIMLTVLSIIATITEETKQGRAKRWYKKLVGGTDIEEELQTLDRLTQEEVRVASAEASRIVREKQSSPHVRD
ncbi:hypothetical protein F5148DRAFT_1150347 [Russula earlei]|uniref:Uncharacterized protein n=1 Tax=Russula earlei TaxID=71964 RepID=A0ACC0U5F7_9AGAM|nr:hypothetical protein F5148DRAFT_1150347 [Russula earlei]